MNFQVMLQGKWNNYEKTEDSILKRAYMSGHKKAKYTLRGTRYEYDFIRMKQKNLESARERDIRPPHKLKPPSKPVVPSGPTMIVKIPPHAAGSVIQVPHPSDKSQMICVEVPKKARVGQAMIVPVPPLSKRPVGHIPTPSGRIPAPSAPPASGLTPAPSAPPASADSTAAKKPRRDVMGVGLAGAAFVGGGAVAGAIIGDTLAESGELDGVIDVAEIAIDDAGDWMMDAGEDAGDFIMDLF
jgi:hypothetical protein